MRKLKQLQAIQQSIDLVNIKLWLNCTELVISFSINKVKQSASSTKILDTHALFFTSSSQFSQVPKIH